LDILTCIFIIKLLACLKLPLQYAVFYAWHPLPIIEIASSGHIDSAAIFFLFLSFIFLAPKKQKITGSQSLNGKAISVLYVARLSPMNGLFAGLFFAAAMLVKWIPLIFLPGMLMLATPGKRKYAVSGFLIGSAVMIGVFWPDMRNSFYTLFVYAANWEFSGFAFRWLRIATGSGTIARAVLAVFFIIAIASVYFQAHKITQFISQTISKIPLNPPLPKGRFEFPYFTPSRTLGSSPGQALPNAWEDEKGQYIFRCGLDIFKAFYAITIAFLFFTPTLHPWYGLYLAVFLPFAAGPAGLVLSWSLFLSYRVVILYGLTGKWIENDWIPFLIIIAPIAAFASANVVRAGKSLFK
jgi:hypothetical protein